MNAACRVLIIASCTTAALGSRASRPSTAPLIASSGRNTRGIGSSTHLLAGVSSRWLPYLLLPRCRHLPPGSLLWRLGAGRHRVRLLSRRLLSDVSIPLLWLNRHFFLSSRRCGSNLAWGSGSHRAAFHPPLWCSTAGLYVSVGACSNSVFLRRSAGRCSHTSCSGIGRDRSCNTLTVGITGRQIAFVFLS